MTDWKKLRDLALAATPEPVIEYRMPDDSWTTDYDAAKKANGLDRFEYRAWTTLERFRTAANPTTVIALLDEIERLKRVIALRDEQNTLDAWGNSITAKGSKR